VLELMSAASAIAVKPNFTGLLQWSVVSNLRSPIAAECTAFMGQLSAATGIRQLKTDL
jgi:hypothetical protein